MGSLPVVEDQQSAVSQRASSPSTNESHPTKDDQYYHDDGDCVISVGGVLFKVHKFLLKRDSTHFEMLDTFSRPNGEGSSDTNPLILSDDPEKFRALCWALYALPTELFRESNNQRDINLILDVAEIAQKYEFRSFIIWSTNVISKHCMQKKTIGNRFVDTCPLTHLKRIYLCADRAHKQQLREAIQTAWMQRLTDKVEEFAEAIDAADEASRADFAGQLYYKLLQSLCANVPTPSALVPSPITTPPELLVSELNESQKKCLSTGYLRLSEYFFRLRVQLSPKSFLPRELTPSHIQDWDRAVASADLGTTSPVDVLKWLQRLSQSLPMWGPWLERPAMTVKKKLKDLSTQLEQKIPDFFDPHI